MPTQPFEAAAQPFPVTQRDPTLMSKVQGEQIVQELDLQTRLLRELLGELRALSDMTATANNLKADEFRRD